MQRLTTFLLMAALCGSALAGQTLKVATLVPAGTTWLKVMQAGADAVAQRTDGRVTLKFYPGGVMGNADAVIRKIRVGQLHGGAFTGGELAAIHPDAQIYSLPFLFRDYREVDHIRAEFDAEVLRGLEAAGWMTAGIGEGGFGYLMSREPVSAVADLNGRRVWVPEGDRIASAAFRSAGVSPVTLPLPDVYTGLQTNLIDTITASTTAAIAMQWHTRVRYYTATPLTYLVGIIGFSQKALARVSVSDRQVLREEMSKAFAEMDVVNRADNEAALQALISQGITAVTPPAAEVAKWQELAKHTLAELKDEGVYTPALLSRIHRRLAEFRSAAQAQATP